MAALMSGWLVMLAFSALVMLGLWKIARIPRAALLLSLATVALAFAGYAWQGNPSLPSAPALALRAAAPIAEADVKAHPLKPAFTRDEMTLNTAEALLRAHNSTGAVALLQGELKGEPGSPDLWMGLGNALVAHSEGTISPAALFAFDKAAALSPAQPLPVVMHAMQLAQAGRMAESAALLQALLARTPKDAPWRADLEERLAAVKARL